MRRTNDHLAFCGSSMLALALLVAGCGSDASGGGDSSTGGQAGSGSGGDGATAQTGGAGGGATGGSTSTGGQGVSGGGNGGTSGSGGAVSTGGQGGTDTGRPPLLDVVPPYFAFGYSSFSATRDWAHSVKSQVGWSYLYWYHLVEASDQVLGTRLQEAHDIGVIPVLTHYQLLDRGRAAGYTGAEEWDVTNQAVEDPALMRAYYDNVQTLMEELGAYDGPAIFQTEPDTTTWLRQYHTGGTNDANDGVVAVASSGHPDLADLPDTIAGYVQALVRLRDRYAKDNVYLGLCIFDNENGYNPEDSVTFIQSIGTQVDLLFTHHVVKYATRDAGWWDAYDDVAQSRFVEWVRTISSATGLRYIHWQTVIGASDYGLMPDYPTVERITPLVEAGSIGNLFDVYSLDGPPHSQPWHGYSMSPPASHPAYNSLDKLVERLGKYAAAPIEIPR